MKVRAPFAEGDAGGDRDGCFLFAFGEDLEEEFGAAAVEFEVAEYLFALLMMPVFYLIARRRAKH